MGYSGIGVLSYWGTRVLRYSGTEVLGYSCTGVQRFWGTEVLEYRCQAELRSERGRGCCLVSTEVASERISAENSSPGTRLCSSALHVSAGLCSSDFHLQNQNAKKCP